MPRKPLKDPENLLNHTLIIRVTENQHKKLKKIAGESDCHSIAEVTRRILAGKKIILFHKDISLNAPMEELTTIRKELKAIGININQQTRYFHASRSAAERAFYVNRTANQYKHIESKVDRLLQLITQLTQKWLQK
ncbi:hypothetical protein EDD80_12512 [Anseongella ginsenosidimutans]|uniref:Mobilization protein MobC n=1 Tax=Anseongella ginsenosidimutans TaxID=496056 RepID=A0A4R3KJK0_9SPHI|nr:mobilization protein [Anseongella ginsenosidimutans]QEC53622.1 mobilization protein [Anseongella ginsenosidimutans]TCS83921.1 hypothetical protein EDD80_12512 [Anseongella ginsenosidimutans]